MRRLRSAWRRLRCSALILARAAKNHLQLGSQVLVPTALGCFPMHNCCLLVTKTDST